MTTDPQPTMRANPFLNLKAGPSNPVLHRSDLGDLFHHWDEEEVRALVYAVAAQRPLLIRGEAGCGKSQIARAAAAHSGGTYFCEVIRPGFEPLELLYRFDMVRRLADAQVTGQLDTTNKRYVTDGRLTEAIRAVQPGSSLPVLLIDEIDKADSDVPNALLNVLGDRRFVIPYRNSGSGEEVIAGHGLPLIVITTNEERELPPAFVRRCAVLNLAPPEEGLIDWLIERGRVHVRGRKLRISERIQQVAAEQVRDDRIACERGGYPRVGLAEYVDLLTALDALTTTADATSRADVAPEDVEQVQADWLSKLSHFALVKHPNQSQRRDVTAPLKAMLAHSTRGSVAPGGRSDSKESGR